MERAAGTRYDPPAMRQPKVLLVVDDPRLTDAGLAALAAAWVHDPGPGRVVLTGAVPIALTTNPHRPVRVHHL